MADLKGLSAEFRERFCAAPALFRAPGRVNIIGDHTDYNGGFVMPVAIQLGTTVAIAPRADLRLRVRSANMSDSFEASLPDIILPSSEPRPRAHHWSDYVAGVAYALADYGVKLRGADLLIHGEVPLGAGLSSSASLEVATALALLSLSHSTLEKQILAKICQRAENEYVGMRCGIMDQFTAVFARRGHALKIDCRSLEYELVELDSSSSGTEAQVQLVICNTLVRHQLATGTYNRRREECEQALNVLQRFSPRLETLRDVSSTLLEAQASRLDPVIYRRCRHVVTENERVTSAAAALQAGAFAQLGQLMIESHRSLRDDYEVSCAELDLMVQLALTFDGVYGARMTGGGFGGCTINVLRSDAVDNFRAQLSAEYSAATGRTPEIYICQAVDGAGPVTPGERVLR